LRDPHFGFTQEADDLFRRLPLPCQLILRELDFELLLKTHQVIRQRRTSVANINESIAVCS